MAEATDILKRKPRPGFLQSEIAISRILAYLTSIPDPDLLLSKAGISRYQLRQLELDDEVAQCMDTRREAVVAAPWRLEPNQTRVGKWLTAMIDPHIETLKRGVMDARFYGYSVFELIYRKIEKGIGLERLSLKPMQWFSPQQDGSLVFFPDDGSGGMEGIFCDPIKFLLTTCNARYENPYGEALLSRLWFPITWRREGWSMWLQFLETFGEPIILGAVQNYQDFVEAMTAQGVRSTVAWQSVTGDDKIETISASTLRDNRLHMLHVQRSADMLLGVPHNWIQYWALLLYFARHAKLIVGTMRWVFGDAHCYLHHSHIETIEHLLKCDPTLQLDNTFNLVYNKNTEAEGVPEFRASDFVMDGTIPEPLVLTKPKLL